MSLSASHNIRANLNPAINEVQLDKRAQDIHLACCQGRHVASNYGLQNQDLIDLLAAQDPETARKMLRTIMDSRGEIPGAAKYREAMTRGYERHATAMANEAGITGDVCEQADQIRDHVKCLRSCEGLSERVKSFNRAYASLSSANYQQERLYSKLSTLKVEFGTSLEGKTAGEVYDLSHISDEIVRTKIASMPTTAPSSGGHWYDGKGTRFEKIPFDEKDPRYNVAYREIFKKDPPVYETAEQIRHKDAVASVRIAIARYKAGEAVQDYVRHNIYKAQYEPDSAPSIYKEAVGQLVSEGKMKPVTQPIAFTGTLDSPTYHHQQYEKKGPTAIPYGQQESKFFANYAFRNTGEVSRLDMTRPEDWGQYVKSGIALMVEERKEKGDLAGVANLKQRVDSSYRLLFTESEYKKLFSTDAESDLSVSAGPARREAEYLAKAREARGSLENKNEANAIAKIAPEKLVRELHLRTTEKLEKIAAHMTREESPLASTVNEHLQKRLEVKPVARELLQDYATRPSQFVMPSSLKIGDVYISLNAMNSEQKKLIEAEIVHTRKEDLIFPRGFEPTRESFVEMKRKLIGFLSNQIDQFAELSIPPVSKTSL